MLVTLRKIGFQEAACYGASSASSFGVGEKAADVENADAWSIRVLKRN